MNLYFGKISNKKEPEQLTECYYRAVKESSWFNGIKPGDYTFMIGGGKIQLWKASEWSKKNGEDVLQFELIHDNLDLDTKKLAAIKYFDINMELIVLTVRSTAKSKKAFFPIFYNDDFTEEMLRDVNTYTNQDSFRKVKILPNTTSIDKYSVDLQLYKDGDTWKLYDSIFISKHITKMFNDNTSMFGGGQKNKDKTIEKIIDPQNMGKSLEVSVLSFLQIYDLFCCDYKRSEIEVESSVEIESEFDISIDNEVNIILYGPPGTGKTFEVLSLIEDLSTEEKGIAITPEGQLDYENNFWHLAPGRNGYLWEKLKSNNYLGYEWCNKNLGDLRNLKSSVDNYAIKKRFSEVQEGDYFCIIRGRECYAIAQAKHDYDFEKAKEGPYDFQTIEIEWLKQFETPILLNTSSTMTFSSVGGRRWDDLEAGLEEKGFTFDDDPIESIRYKQSYSFTTFHQSYSYEDFIEGIKPQLNDENTDDNNETGGDISYEIQPGVFYNACDRAAQLANYNNLEDSLKDTKVNRNIKFSKAPPYYLIIDELNRGNVANVFGELITLIENDKRLGSKYETIAKLPYSKKDFGVPSNLILIGTMNTADRSIEALDSALRRRFSFIGKYPEPELLSEISIDGVQIDLCKLLSCINDRIEMLLDRDHLIGHSYFMGIKSTIDLVATFKNKVIPLLEEYFYERTEMIGLILGSSFVKKKSQVPLSDFKQDFYDTPIRDKYYIEVPETIEAYKNIYAGN